MAEGLVRGLLGESFTAYSAGTAPQRLNPLAVQVMREIGIDISGHYSKPVDELHEVPIDYVVTVCAAAHEACPVWPGPAKVVHHGFDDPPQLAALARTDEERLGHYRRVRDEIRKFVLSLPKGLTDE